MRERQHRMAPKIFVQEPLAQFPGTNLPTIEQIEAELAKPAKRRQ